MNQSILFSLLLAGTVLVNGCAFHRANVAALSQEQDAYYAKLDGTLRESRDKLKLGFTEQLKADRVRQRNLLAWERDLAKAEILLQVDANTSGNRGLLLMKTAESDLASLGRVQALEEIDRNRLQAIMDLYDAVIKAVDALQKNNQVITRYLSSSERTFVLRSLDVQEVVTAVSTLRDVQNQLKGVEARSAQEKSKENERLQNEVERARDVLIKVLKK
jgi:hypothetical protein